MNPVTDYTHESMILGRSFFTADPRPLELVLIALGGCALVWAVLEMIHLIGRYLLKRRLGIDRMQHCLKDLGQLEATLVNRIYANKDAVKSLSDETDTLRKRSDALWQAVRDSQDVQSRHTRLLGNETKTNRCFVALVYNRHVEHWTQLGRSHAYIHDSWSKPQQVQVWAHSESEAMKLLVSRYPDTFGYVVLRMVPVQAARAEVAHGG